jgi:hypothetical protein
MPRRLEWTKSQKFQGFRCSECDWKFKASGAPAGASLDEMKKKYEAERDEAFAGHVCVSHPRPKRAKDPAEQEKGKYWKL